VVSVSRLPVRCRRTVVAFLLASASPAEGASYAYVANLDGTLSQYGLGGGTLSPKQPPFVPAGDLAVLPTVSRSGKSVYVGDESNGQLLQYDAGAGGALSPKSPAVVDTPGPPAAMAVSPDGRSVYVANYLDAGSVSQYDVGRGEALSPKTRPTVAAPPRPTDLSVSPDGKSVYVISDGGVISQYDVAAGGALSPKSPPTVESGGFASAVTVSPDSGSVYVTNARGVVSQYDAGAGGALSPKSPASVPAGASPEATLISPDGRSVYVHNKGENTVSQYDVGPGGALSPKSPPTAPVRSRASVDPSGMAISPDGHSVYVVIADAVEQYDVGAGGLLSDKSPPTVDAGTEPIGVAVSPDGESVYVTAGTAGCGPSCILQYDATPVGELAPLSPATVTVGGRLAGVAVSPNGTSAYVASDRGSAFQYDLGLGGALSPKNPPSALARELTARGGGDARRQVGLRAEPVRQLRLPVRRRHWRRVDPERARPRSPPRAPPGASQ
jgi:DNA-binding beta-propeller fold protein YncE